MGTISISLGISELTDVVGNSFLGLNMHAYQMQHVWYVQSSYQLGSKFDIL